MAKRKHISIDYLEDLGPIDYIEDGIFDIDIEKGLYIGAGISLASEDENELSTVRPIILPWKSLAGHFGILGTTRVGKTRLMASLIRQCILKGLDLLIVEPKGAADDQVDEFGNDAEAGRIRDLRYISPKFPDLSTKFNPLFALSNEEISSLVATIIPAKDEFFSTMGEQITMCVLLGLEFLEQVEGYEAIQKIIDSEYKKHYASGVNIVNVEDSLSDPDLAERIMTGGGDYDITHMTPPYRSLVTFSDLATYTTQEGVSAILQFVNKITPDMYQTKDSIEIEALNRMKSEAVKALSEMAEKDKQYFSKVSSSFSLVMQKLSTGDLGKILCTTKINPLLDRFYSDRGQIIFIQPFPLLYKEVSKAFVRIFFTFIGAYYGNIGASGRKPKRELFLFIDEGGAVLFPGVEDFFNKAGGLGMRIVLLSQSVADYDAALGSDISRIINDNINIKAFMRGNDPTSKKIIMDTFSTIRRNVTGHTGSKLDMKISTKMEDMAVLNAAHIANMQNQEFLLQYGEGRFYCIAPFQEDPPCLFRMPEVHMEASIRKNVEKFQAQIEELQHEEVVVKKEFANEIKKGN